MIAMHVISALMEERRAGDWDAVGVRLRTLPRELALHLADAIEQADGIVYDEYWRVMEPLCIDGGKEHREVPCILCGAMGRARVGPDMADAVAALQRALRRQAVAHMDGDWICVSTLDGRVLAEAESSEESAGWTWVCRVPSLRDCLDDAARAYLLECWEQDAQWGGA